jgi:mycofactocin glycosyltransferase
MSSGRTFRLDGSVRRLDGGRVLLGGSPLVLLRLSEAGARFVDRLAAGEPVPPGRASATLLDRLLDTGAVHPVAVPGAGPFGPADVTVVIPVKDRDVSRTVAALGPVGRVLVVDDGSDPPLAVPPGAEVLRREEAGGPAAARNAGLAAVTTPVVAFVDSDVVPCDGWLPVLLAHLADERVALVAPRVRAPEPGIGASAVARYERWRSALDLGAQSGRIAPRTRVGFVPAAALVARTDALRDLGGFDEAMIVGEDVDLVWRLHDAGRRCRYEPAAEVRHDVRDGLRAWARRRMDYGTSAGPLEQRHPGRLAPLGVSGWSAAAWTLVAAGHPVLGVATAAGSAAALPRKLGDLANPWRATADIAGRGHLAAWRPIAGAITRAWWPMALPAALVSRRARRAVIASALVPPLLAWWQDRPALDPVRASALWLADDMAYGAGVWIGSVRSRTAGPLRPDLGVTPPWWRRTPP